MTHGRHTLAVARGRHAAPTTTRPSRRRTGFAVLAVAALVATTASSAQAATRTGPPIGNVDKVVAVDGGVRVEGWAWDPDTTDPVTVELHVGSQTVVKTATAYRPDVARVFPEAGSNRGFATTVPTRGGEITICVVAQNVGPGSDRSFPCRTVNVVNDDPVGSLDVVAAQDDGTVTVRGWADDMNATGAVSVRLTAGDATSTVSTGEARPDVPTVIPWADGATGWSSSLSGLSGSTKVCAVALNVGPGSDTPLGCRTLDLPAGTASATPTPTPTTSPSPSPSPSPTASPSPSPSPSPTTGTPSSWSLPVGVPAGTSLTVHHGDLTVTTPGAVISNLDIRGYLRIKAPNVTVKNTIVRGASGLTGSMSLVQASSTGTKIIDSELVAQYPTWGIDGIVGSGFTLTRVNIHGVVDSVKITGDNVTVEDSWLHDNLYYASTPSGGDTHNDNVQIQVGTNITVRNSVLTSTRNSGMIITQDRGDVSNVTFTNNRADDGACTINIAEKSYGPIHGLTIADNVFGAGQLNPHCAVIGPDSTTKISTITANPFTDGPTFRVSPGN
ncbi:hypothetical protein OEB99_15955 [Actinotalea sp. M2MS4P-6]|uniref:hypothetical protein n=1 Tax=Actinotalea sp. M2MS4P-6 TaxID=2983762 RepID=UPI0021E4584C|nr:hypothetical protein [Actinotalea sp. M2MS4P-6]MCV2395809.1 hypothetical protein [Actinotalea sp. M2MS4P-6]